MEKYVQYAKSLRHELHQIPEIGFDLPKTLAVIRRELDAMGIMLGFNDGVLQCENENERQRRRSNSIRKSRNESSCSFLVNGASVSGSF